MVTLSAFTSPPTRQILADLVTAAIVELALVNVPAQRLVVADIATLAGALDAPFRIQTFLNARF